MSITRFSTLRNQLDFQSKMFVHASILTLFAENLPGSEWPGGALFISAGNAPGSHTCIDI